MFVWLGVALLLTGLQLVLAIALPVHEPAWTNFAGAALGAGLAGQAALHVVPQGHRARPWPWASQIALMAFAGLALIASFARLA